MVATNSIPQKTLERLILYRWILKKFLPSDADYIVSRRLSELTGFSSAQIRRDLMNIGYYGTSSRGYKIHELINSISQVIDPPSNLNIAVVGIGQLGRAVLNYIQGRSSVLRIKAAFDKDISKTDRVIHGCRTYHIDNLEEIVTREKISIAILAVPPDQAQDIAYRLVKVGVKAFLNYSPIKLNLPDGVYVENRDMLLAVEKIAFFARTSTERTQEHEGIS